VFSTKPLDMDTSEKTGITKTELKRSEKMEANQKVQVWKNNYLRQEEALRKT